VFKTLAAHIRLHAVLPGAPVAFGIDQTERGLGGAESNGVPARRKMHDGGQGPDQVPAWAGAGPIPDANGDAARLHVASRAIEAGAVGGPGDAANVAVIDALDVGGGAPGKRRGIIDVDAGAVDKADGDAVAGGTHL